MFQRNKNNEVTFIDIYASLLMCWKHVSKHVSCTCLKHACFLQMCRLKFPTKCYCRLTFSRLFCFTCNVQEAYLLQNSSSPCSYQQHLLKYSNLWKAIKGSQNIIIFCSHVTAMQLWANTLYGVQQLKVYVVLYKPNIASFRGHSHLQFLIACSMQKQRQAILEGGTA